MRSACFLDEEVSTESRAEIATGPMRQIWNRLAFCELERLGSGMFFIYDSSRSFVICDRSAFSAVSSWWLIASM